ncbi:hypothetical protein LAZ67_5003704 [Cordylochernes scorpioides]|uniref:BPTI/Kunitz inhibitor domain-containing protein n=1 Tax=Cordylochernes scorpioides TaxID=51811 RepID=A0ABY6KI50_9ARAC|nr:hypothetical protein LAZ67_5003704 [Cordylochernes scorpioides]
MNLMKEIVAFTNKCAQTLLASNRDKLPPFSRKLAWKDTTLDEMMAFIGVIFNMGNVKKNQIRDYWSKNELLEMPWFGKVMSRGRFELLYSCFSLIDDFNLVPSSHPDYNPTARFEKLIEHVNNKFIYYYKPTQNLTVDESLMCLKNRTRLRQYMPQKHHGRFGVKLWMLCESKTGYCLRMKPYKGKLSPIIKSLSYDVPMNLLQESSLLGKGYHLITDNFFTSINLAKDLLDSHTYLTGTIRTNRKGLPKTLTSAKLGVDESLYMVNNNLLALAYKEKKSKPPVKFLSTFCDASSGKKKVSDQRDYPQMKICYDSYMGGVDLNDQMLYTYMDERKGRKFYRKVILNIFHRALLNSFILYEQHTKDNPKLYRRAFNYSVINELVKNHLKPPVLPSTSQEVLEKLPEKRESRCVECTKEYLKRRSRIICSKCKRGLHPTHTPSHFSGGTFTAQRYRDEILEPYLRPYRDQIDHNLIFMDDNARPHRARLVNEYLQSENIRRMDWPARSPDLNPIEHVWDALGRRIGSRHPSPRTLVELRTALLEEWGLLPLNLLQSLYLTYLLVLPHDPPQVWLADSGSGYGLLLLAQQPGRMLDQSAEFYHISVGQLRMDPCPRSPTDPYLYPRSPNTPPAVELPPYSPPSLNTTVQTSWCPSSMPIGCPRCTQSLDDFCASPQVRREVPVETVGQPADGGTEEDPCLAPPSAGPCHNFTTRYYYHSSSQTCRAFHYGGCGGTANNFPSMEQCLSLCPARQQCRSYFLMVKHNVTGGKISPEVPDVLTYHIANYCSCPFIDYPVGYALLLGPKKGLEIWLTQEYQLISLPPQTELPLCDTPPTLP